MKMQTKYELNLPISSMNMIVGCNFIAWKYKVKDTMNEKNSWHFCLAGNFNKPEDDKLRYSTSSLLSILPAGK